MKSSCGKDFSTNIEELQNNYSRAFVKYLTDETDIVNCKLEDAIDNLRMNIWSPKMYIEFLKVMFQNEVNLIHHYGE